MRVVASGCSSHAGMSDTTPDRTPTEHVATDATGNPLPCVTTPTVDLEPLAQLIREQGRELQQLRESNAVWQFRAMQAEEQLKQLTATSESANDESSEPVGSSVIDHSADQASEQSSRKLRRNPRASGHVWRDG
jgi:hypothetical protein